MTISTMILVQNLIFGAIVNPNGYKVKLDGWMSFFLPPIIFCAGIMVDKCKFDRNKKVILIRGTIANFVSLLLVSQGAAYFFPKLGIDNLSSIDYLAIGAIFLPNNFIYELPAFPFPQIEIYDDHSIVFGEGTLSTGTAILLLKLIRRHDFSFDASSGFFLGIYLFKIISASSLLGMLVGWLLSFRGWIATNFVSKFINSNYHLHLIRGTTVILFIPAYMTFIFAEFLNLSGAVSVFCYGVALSHYMFPKDPREKTIWRDDIYRLSSLAKWASIVPVAICFGKYYQWTNLGHRLGTLFSASTVLFVFLILGRAVSVIPLSSCWWLGEINMEEKINDSSFANLWNRPYVSRDWTLAKKKAKYHKPDILLISRWGIKNITPQIVMWGCPQTATGYLQCIIWMSHLMPSLVSYVLAYEQFGKSGDDQQAFVFNCVTTVYLFITLVFSLGHETAIWRMDPSFLCFPDADSEIVTEDGREFLRRKPWASKKV